MTEPTLTKEIPMGDEFHVCDGCGHPDGHSPTCTHDVGLLVASKQVQYGDAVTRTAEVLRVLYPDGIRLDQYADVFLVTRVVDKLSRISSRSPGGLGRGGESPYNDIAGYGILGVAKDRVVVIQRPTPWTVSSGYRRPKVGRTPTRLDLIGACRSVTRQCG